MHRHPVLLAFVSGPVPSIPQFNADKLDQAKASLSKAGWDNFVLGGNYVSGRMEWH